MTINYRQYLQKLLDYTLTFKNLTMQQSDVLIKQYNTGNHAGKYADKAKKVLSSFGNNDGIID